MAATAAVTWAAWAAWADIDSSVRFGRTENRTRWEEIPAAFFVLIEVIDRFPLLAHFSDVKSLLEIEEAIAKLPAKARRQLVQDIPALCPAEFPADGWDAILHDDAPRSSLAAHLDKLDAEHLQNPESFFTLNDKSLRTKK